MALRLLFHGVIAALISSLTLGMPAYAAAETTPDEQRAESAEREGSESSNNGFSTAHRRQLYKQGRLSYGKAILYNTLPGLGNFYANQYVLGGVALSLIGFVAVLVPFGVVTDQPTFIWVGTGVAGFAYGGSVTTSLFGVRAYNRRLHESLQLDESHSAFLRDLPRSRQLTLLNLQF